MKSTLTFLGWLIRDTFRQALASGIFWFMLAVTILCVLVCLTAKVQEPDMALGPVQIQLAFGLLRTLPAADGPTAVRALQLLLAGGVADVGGLVLALIWTAGFLPSFLDSGAISVLLAKPVPRWVLLCGKVVGVLAIVAVQIVLFIAGTWLALGVRTGVWDLAYFVAMPLLLLHFAVFFSFSTMLAVALRSTVVCVFGSLLFWLICVAMNLGRHAVALLPDVQAPTRGLGRGIELAYWTLPKPLDFHLLLQELLQGQGDLIPLVNLGQLQEAGAWRPGLSILASVIVALIFLGLALYDFLTADY